MFVLICLVESNFSILNRVPFFCFEFAFGAQRSNLHLYVSLNMLKAGNGKKFGVTVFVFYCVWIFLCTMLQIDMVCEFVMALNSTDIKLVVWIGGLELVARPFFLLFFYF